MTTIACDGKSMAGDGLITENDHVCFTDYKKVRRLTDGSIIGFAGNCYNWQSFGDWIDGGCQGDVPQIDGNITCLHLKIDGSLRTYDHFGRAFPEQAPAAIGSGARFAIGWMDAGHDAHSAVAYTIKRDIFTGGTITVLHLVPSE